jgi:hypothetical protein
LETIIIEANKEVRNCFSKDYSPNEIKNKTNSEDLKKFRIKNDISVKDLLSLLF